MSILIKGMEMPSKKAIAVVIHPDGTAYSAEMFAGVCTEYLADCTAVPVPTPGIEAVDGVRVVQCGDCKWWTKQETSAQGRCALLGNYPTATWFCANGNKSSKGD